ncbi:MAG: sigma-70 family RNA polymerase sigma factor [Thermoanaerobaculia bacterium]
MATMIASLRSAHPDEAFAELMSGIKPTAIRICRRYRIPPQDAEDLMQQALIALLDVRFEVEDPQAWLAGTLRNQCLMYWRRRRRCLYKAIDTAILDELADPTTQHQTIELNHDLGRVIGRLPSRCKSVLELRYGMGCEPRETAERLGYRSSSIYKILDRCLAALSRSLTVTGLAPRGSKGPGAATQCQLAESD